jgi:uncharacterized protein YjbJ (UPF0337 family)
MAETLDWNRIAGVWSEYKGIAKAHWGRLTDNDLIAIEGSRDLLIGKLQVRYGLAREDAEAQVDGWLVGLVASAIDPLKAAARYASPPVGQLTQSITRAAETSIRQNSALVFAVTALGCFLLGASWKRLVR